MTIKSEEGALLLFEAIMEQAHKDLGDKNLTIRNDAEEFINDMKNKFSAV